MIRFLEIQGPNCRETLHRPLPKATLVCKRGKKRRRRRTCTRALSLSHFHYGNITELIAAGQFVTSLDSSGSVRLRMRPAVGPSYRLFVGRSAEPLDNPARPHWPLPTVHATQAQNQTEDWHEPVSLFIDNAQTFPQPKPVAKLQLTL